LTRADQPDYQNRYSIKKPVRKPSALERFWMTTPVAFFRRLELVPQGVVLILVAFLPSFAIVAMFPAVPALVAHFAADPSARWKVPMMVSAPGLTIAALSPFAGMLVDRFGRRPLMLWAALLYAVAGMAPFVLASLDAIFVSRLFVGAAEAAILTISNTLIGDYWRDGGRRDWLFLQGIVGPFFSTLALLGVGAIVGRSWNAVFLVYAIAIPIAAAIAAFIFEPGRDASPAVRPELRSTPSGFPWRTVAGTCALTLLASVLYFVFIINGGLVWQEVGVTSPEAISRVSAIPTLFILLGAFLFRVLSGRTTNVQLGAAFLFLGAGLTVIGLAPDWRVLAAGLVVQQTGAGMMVVSLIAWVSGKLPYEHRGRGMGAWASAFFLGQFVSPAIVHQLNLIGGTMQSAFLAMGLIGIAVAVTAVYQNRFSRDPHI
jgi:MFS family permease